MGKYIDLQEEEVIPKKPIKKSKYVSQHRKAFVDWVNKGFYKQILRESKDIKLNTLLYLKSKGIKGPNALENYTKLVSKNMRSVKNMSEIEQAKFQKQKLHQLKHDFEHWVSKNNIKIENLAIDMLKASGLANEFI